jgi:hypothetical protein
MAKKISTIVDETIWEELKAYAKSSHQNLSGLLTEALRDFLRKKQIRPEFVRQMERSLATHEDLGRLLAK